MDRRTLLGLPLLGATTAMLAACGGGGGGDQMATSESPDSPDAQVPAPKRIGYGPGPQQFGELHLPAGTPKGVVIVIHGGFWLDQYDYTLGTPLAASLAEHGWAAWNLEYRRVGDGGGDPATFDDVAAGVDQVAELGLPGAALDTVVTLGHSAGGHLGTWAASRGRFAAWKPARVAITAVVSQAGVLDLRAAYQENLGGGAVQNFLGHAPGDADDPLDPIRQVPLDVPVWCVHGDADQNVPISQSQDYVKAATGGGATAELHEVSGDHFTLIDPTSQAWADTLAHLDTL